PVNLRDHPRLLRRALDGVTVQEEKHHKLPDCLWCLVASYLAVDDHTRWSQTCLRLFHLAQSPFSRGPRLALSSRVHKWWSMETIAKWFHPPSASLQVRPGDE